MVYPALLPLMRTSRLPVVNWTDAPADLMDSLVAPKDEIWFLCVCHHISTDLYKYILLASSQDESNDRSEGLSTILKCSVVGLKRRASKQGVSGRILVTKTLVQSQSS